MGEERTVPRTGLAGALFSLVRQRVLALLFGQPDRDFSTSDVIRLAGSGTGAVHRELSRLAEVGLVTVAPIGNQKRYRANRESPVFNELHGLIVKTAGLVDPLRKALSDYKERIDVAFVYGSIAKGGETASSDIDLMVMGDELTYSDAYSALHDAERILGRTISPTVTSFAEWKEKLRKKNSFATRVSHQPKLFVLGSEDDLPRA